MSYAKLLAGGAAAVGLAFLTPVAVTAMQPSHAQPAASPTVVTSTIAPSAAPTVPVTTPSATPTVQPSSMPGGDRQLANQLPVVDRIMDILQHARDDYSGDRAKAITALNHAREDLRQAVKADNQSETTSQNLPSTPIESAAGSENGTMAQSNEKLSDARAMIDQVIQRLQHDGHDYGGYRVKAIADLQQARADITDALVNSNQ